MVAARELKKVTHPNEQGEGGVGTKQPNEMFLDPKVSAEVQSPG